MARCPAGWLTLVLVFFALAGPAKSQEPGMVGFLEPYLRVELGFPEAGVVGAVHVREGQRVAKGEILAELDNRVLEASIAIARARSDSDVEIRLAEINLQDRVNRHQQLEDLRQRGNAREDEVVRAALDRELANEELRAARERRRINRLEYARILAQRDQRRIVSPLDGVVIGVDKQVGETVNAVDSPVVQIAKLDILKLVLRIEETRARTLRHASRVRLTAAGSEQPVTAAVEYVSPVLDPRSGTVEVWVVVGNSSSALKSGQRASVEWD